MDLKLGKILIGVDLGSHSSVIALTKDIGSNIGNIDVSEYANCSLVSSKGETVPLFKFPVSCTRADAILAKSKDAIGETCNLSSNVTQMIYVPRNSCFNFVTPTIISFNWHQRSIGEEAESKLMSNPSSTINHLLEILGLSFSDVLYIKNRFRYTFRYSLLKDEKNDKLKIPIKFNGSRYEVTTEFLLSIFIRKLLSSTNCLQFAESRFAISVPSYYNDRQFESLKRACSMAGLKNVEYVRNYEAMISWWAQMFINRKFEGCFSYNRNYFIVFLDYGYSHTCMIVGILKSTKANEMHYLDSYKLKILSTEIDGNLGTHEIVTLLMNYVILKTDEKHKKKFDWNNKQGIKLYNTVTPVTFVFAVLTDSLH